MKKTSGKHPAEGEKASNSHWILWTAVSVFIVAAIAGMWAIDYYFSPEMINSTTLPDAAGK